MLGTFHCKFMVVDRKMAILCSNNIQDRPNMEMMCHLEGPIVDSMYDTALISWYKAMDPPLPLLSRPYQPPEGGYKFGMENEYATTHILDGSKGEELFRQYKEKGEQARDEDESQTSEEAKGDGRVFIAGKYQTITDHISECLRPFGGKANVEAASHQMRATRRQWLLRTSTHPGSTRPTSSTPHTRRCPWSS